MAKTEMKAKKTFYMNGRFIRAGESFTVPEYGANTYVTRNLAERLEAETKVSEPTETKAGEITEEPVDSMTDEKTYSEMTKTELVDLARERAIKGYSKMTIPELIQAHETYDNNQTVEGNEA